MLECDSMTIDTACSGSLISVDLACRYLDTGDADGAIVAGNNLYMSPEHNMDASAMNSAASPTGRCWTFDARADGYIKAEAVNAIILKRLDDAIRDGDPIRAVIRGSSTNSDGWTPGIASPSSDAQASAIRRAYARAGISNFGDTAYLECHGTGTLAGDPVETKAAATVFSQGRTTPLRIGSVKSNIGHSEPAAGISGMLKTILAIENGIIPGNPTFEIPNPNIDFKALHVAPSKSACTWPQGMLKRASVNSFGYGGSNAHTILEHPTVLAACYRTPNVSSYAAVQDDFLASDDEGIVPKRVFLLSANDEASLKALAKSYVRHLSNPAVSVKSLDLAYTLSERRTKHFHRGYLISRDTDFKENQFTYGKLQSSAPKFGFVFTGQGAQWPRMGRELLESFPIAKRVVQELDAALQTLAEPPRWSLLAELTQRRTPEHMRQPEFSQPLVTALQLALLAVLDDWGVHPQAVVGHSSGEIAASTAAGLLTREEAIKVAYFRGKASLAVCTQKLGMLAVGIGQLHVEEYLKATPSVKIACINSSKSVTLSGQSEDLQLLEATIKADGHFARLLQVELAYHSDYMTEIASHYLRMLIDECPNLGTTDVNGEVKFYSTVIGAQMKTGTDAEYWFCNMICPVQFSQGLECLIKEGGVDHLIELGPSGALAGPISQIKQSIGGSATSIEYSAALARGADSIKPLFDMAGRMFFTGAPIDYMKVNQISSGDQPKVIVDLPNYHWNHSTKYWHESLSSRDWRYRKFPIHDLLGSKVLGTSWSNPSFRRVLRLNNVPWLKDHRVRLHIELHFTNRTNSLRSALMLSFQLQAI
jgi:acyl transferase domain-containing protein